MTVSETWLYMTKKGYIVKNFLEKLFGVFVCWPFILALVELFHYMVFSSTLLDWNDYKVFFTILWGFVLVSIALVNA